MKNYLEESIKECGMNIMLKATTPAKRTLFEVDPKLRAMNKEEGESFHRIVAKLLYVYIWARVDILLPVGFLCTRVSTSTEQDQAKLKRVLEYINGTINLEYTLGADSLNKLWTWVDASYAVHPDMEIHTGGLLSLSLGGIAQKSTKHKLNTKSSTEAELVQIVLWVQMFVEAQGYKIE